MAQPDTTRPRYLGLLTPPSPGSLRGCRQAKSAALGVSVPNVRWTEDRIVEALDKMAFALRELPGPLAKLRRRVLGAFGFDPTALPALPKALCRACVEGAEAGAALAVFHETDSTDDLRRLLKEKLEARGADDLAIGAIEAEIARRAE